MVTGTETLTQSIVEPNTLRRLCKIHTNMEPYYSALAGLLEDGVAFTRADAKAIHVSLGGSHKTNDFDLVTTETLSSKFGFPVMERVLGKKQIYSHPDKEDPESVRRAITSITPRTKQVPNVSTYDTPGVYKFV